MALITLWHNPRCSKSRETLDLLQSHGADVTVRRYLDDAPSIEEIRAALDILAVAPIDMMRTGEAAFKSLDLTKSSPDEALITAMAQNPILIERPIAFTETDAKIGRPPEATLALLR